MAVEEKAEGMEMACLAKEPRIAGQMIVPLGQTNGIAAHARAMSCQGMVNVREAYHHARAS